MSFWTPLSYQSGWSDYGSPYEGGACKLDGDRVYLRGVIQTTNSPGHTPMLVATLPTGYAPPASEAFVGGVFTINSPDFFGSGILMFVDSSGNLYCSAGAPVSDPITLNNFSFSILP